MALELLILAKRQNMHSRPSSRLLFWPAPPNEPFWIATRLWFGHPSFVTARRSTHRHLYRATKRPVLSSASKALFSPAFISKFLAKRIPPDPQPYSAGLIIRRWLQPLKKLPTN